MTNDELKRIEFLNTVDTQKSKGLFCCGQKEDYSSGKKNNCGETGGAFVITVSARYRWRVW